MTRCPYSRAPETESDRDATTVPNDLTDRLPRPHAVFGGRIRQGVDVQARHDRSGRRIARSWAVLSRYWLAASGLQPSQPRTLHVYGFGEKPSHSTFHWYGWRNR